ncbi:MAG TPA: hypothetical protein VMV91_09435 [Rhodocyclaceae bacterium]|nr:hypothetical protein [Rhodocyclaceae bacterium]HUX24248.1 hypothetical protein [Burkholderiales bacterium]
MIELFAKESSREFFSFLYQTLAPVTLSRIEKVEKVESPGYSSYSTFSIGGGAVALAPPVADGLRRVLPGSFQDAGIARLDHFLAVGFLARLKMGERLNHG